MHFATVEVDNCTKFPEKGRQTYALGMVIERVDTRIVELPLPRPIGTAIHQMRSVGCALTTITTVDGVTGEGFAFALNGDRIRAFDEAIKGLAPYVVGQDPGNVEQIFEDIWAALNPSGHAGIGISALSAIDVALWDIVAKTADTSLAKLWGSQRTHVDTYASSGLWLSDPIDELISEAGRFVDQGFTAMKIRLGSPDASTDVERVRALRDAVGTDIAIYSDLNQGLDVDAAIELGTLLDSFELAWIEEPVIYYDFAGHALVRAALNTPIASGETEYTRLGMQRYLEAEAVDVLMPDLQRMGGYTEFRRACALADTYNIPTSSHFFTEYSLALAGAVPNCALIEHVDWFQPLFNESIEIKNGQLVIPDRPGTGFTFR